MRNASASPEMECLNFEEYYDANTTYGFPTGTDDGTVTVDRTLLADDDDNMTVLFNGVENMHGTNTIAADLLSEASEHFPSYSPPRRAPPAPPTALPSFFIEEADSQTYPDLSEPDTTYASYMKHLEEEAETIPPIDVSLASVQTAAPVLPSVPSVPLREGPVVREVAGGGGGGLESLQYSAEIQRLHLVIEDMREHHEREMRSVRRSLKQTQGVQEMRVEKSRQQEEYEGKMGQLRQMELELERQQQEQGAKLQVLKQEMEIAQQQQQQQHHQQQQHQQSQQQSYTESLATSPRRRSTSPSHTENAALIQEVASLQRQLRVEKERVSEREHEIDIVEADLEAARLEVKELQQKLEQCKAASPARKSEGAFHVVDKEMIQASKEFKELKQSLTDVSNDRAAVVTEMGKMRQQLQHSEDGRKELAHTVRGHEDTASKAAKTEASLKEECSRLRNELRTLQEKLRRTDGIVASVTAEKQDAQDTVKSVRTQLRDRDDELERASQDTQTLKQSLTELETIKGKLEHSYNTLQHESAHAQKQRQAAQAKLEEAQGMFSDLDRKYQNSQLEISQLKHTITEQRSERTEKLPPAPQQRAPPPQQQPPPQPREYEPNPHFPPRHDIAVPPDFMQDQPQQGMTRRAIREAQQRRDEPVHTHHDNNPSWAPTNSEMKVLKKILHRYDDPHEVVQRPPSPHFHTPVHQPQAQPPPPPRPLVMEETSYHHPATPPRDVHTFQSHPQHHAHPSPQASHYTTSAVAEQPHVGQGSLGGGFGLSALAGIPTKGKKAERVAAPPPPPIAMPEGSVPRHVNPAQTQERIQWLEDTLVSLQHLRSKKDDELAKLQQTKAKSIADRKYRMKAEQDIAALEKDINLHKREMRQLMQPRR